MNENLLGGPPPTHLPDDPEPRELLAAGTSPADVAAKHPTSSLAWARLADGHLAVADLEELGLRQRPLVVLSACETGRGSPRGGGLVGMARGFMLAGAQGLVASLWKIADSSTARLMGDFYAELGAAGPAAALARPSSTTTTGPVGSACSRSSSRRAAPGRSRHQPSGTDPTTLAASTSTVTVGRAPAGPPWRAGRSAAASARTW